MRVRRLFAPLGRVALFALIGAGLVPSPLAAQFTLFETNDARLLLSGYVRTFTGVHDRGFDLPRLPAEAEPRTTGFHGQVIRVKWQVEGDGWRFDLHDRFQARVNSGRTEGPVLGFGVSAVPDRLVDLETELVSEPGLRVWHDVDRLSLSLFTGPVDLTVGRQAITWGMSGIYPVADLWARFSPFELDTEEKPGIDAVRALFYPVRGLEMDAVIADRGSRAHLSAGVRGTYSLPRADVWAGAGKFWREAMAMGGVTILLDDAKLRAEAVLPWDLDDGTAQDPRATVGVDWISGTLMASAEYHFNGIGAPDPEGYTAVLEDPRFTRGETYYLGRHYLGGTVRWSPDEENRVALALTSLANLGDGSLALTPLLAYDFGQATRVSLGGLLSVGDTPRFETHPPTLGSEFGTYGSLVYLGISVFF